MVYRNTIVRFSSFVVISFLLVISIIECFLNFVKISISSWLTAYTPSNHDLYFDMHSRSFNTIRPLPLLRYQRLFAPRYIAHSR